MSVRVDTSSLIVGACVVGNRGLGVTGAIIRATTGTGGNGPGYLYNDWTSGDDAKEFRGLIVTPPASGVFFAYEDGSFDLTGAVDGVHNFVYRLFIDGADLGTATASITVGSAAIGSASVTVIDSDSLDDSESVMATIVSPDAPATIVTGQFRERLFGTLLPSTLIPWVRVTDPLTAEVVLLLSDQTTALDATLTISNAALTVGKTYVVDAFDTSATNTGSRGEVAH
jgi:hypothetical protein